MKRLVSLLISVIILLMIYTTINISELAMVFARSDSVILALALAMVAPLVLVTAWRLVQLTPRTGELRLGEAIHLALAASVLNMVLPSKMGDLAKAYFMQDRGYVSGGLAFALVVFEKTLDMLSLLLWCVFGLLTVLNEGTGFWIALVVIGGGLLTGSLIIGSPRTARTLFTLGTRFAPKKLAGSLGQLEAGWNEMHHYFWQDRRKLALIATTSIFLWFLHLVQIWLFILALQAWAPFLTTLALTPLSILAGLAPLTFAGIGTRDAALIVLYRPYLSSATAAALGVLCTMRYVLPALGGLPFFYKYVSLLRQGQVATRSF